MSIWTFFRYPAPILILVIDPAWIWSPLRPFLWRQSGANFTTSELSSAMLFSFTCFIGMAQIRYKKDVLCSLTLFHLKLCCLDSIFWLHFMSREAPLWGTWLRHLYIKLIKSCKGKKKKWSPASGGFWSHNLYIGRGCNSERCVIICCHIPLRLIYSSFFLPQSGFMSGSRTLHSWDVPLKNVDWALLQDKWPNLADYALKRPNFNKQAKGELHRTNAADIMNPWSPKFSPSKEKYVISFHYWVNPFWYLVLDVELQSINWRWLLHWTLVL